MTQGSEKTVSLAERLAVHAAVGVIGLIVLIDAATLPGASAIFPRVVGSLLIAMPIISAIVSWRDATDRETPEAHLRHGIPGLILLFGFIWSASAVGFLTSLIWFLPALALVGGERRPLWILGLTVGFGVLVYLVFGVLFEQPLPDELILGEL